MQHPAAVVDRLVAVGVTQQEGDGRDRLAAVGQAVDKGLEVLGAAAEGRQLDGVRAGAWQEVLVGEVLLPVDRGGAAEVVEVIQLAIPAGADAVGDAVLAVPPAFGAAGDARLLGEVVARVAEVAARVVDPGAAVLASSAAFKGDPHRRVDVGGVDLVADGAGAHVVEQVAQGDRIDGQTRDAA